MYTNIYYFYYLSDIGGTETFLYQLARKYKDKDLTIIYRYGDDKQIARLKKFVRCVKFQGQKIQCKRAFFNYGIDIIDSVEAEDYCFVIHADYEDQMKRGQLAKIPDHPKLNRFIAVSKRAADGFRAVTGKKVEVCHNPFTIDKPNKVLHLISATRLSVEKGKTRMIKLAEMLEKAGIKYIWHIFTNDKGAIDNPNICYMKPRLDILDYIADADYLVQLSDNEGFCYSVVEALTADVPVIVTPCPVFDEIGLVDGVNCYKVPFDMKDFDVKKLLNIPKNFNYIPPADRWDELLLDEPSTWEKEQHLRYKVKATSAYQEKHISDGELHKIPEPGDTWIVTPERMNILIGNNALGIKFATVVEEIEE